VIKAFGPKATAYAERLGEVNAIVADPEVVGTAYQEAVRWRNEGGSFYGVVCVDDPRVAFGYAHAEAIFRQLPDFDARRYVVDQLVIGAMSINGKRADEVWPFEPALEHIFVEFLTACDGLLVRSYEEHARVAGWFARDPVRRLLPPVERILAATSVPAAERVRPERPSVVVWAPGRTAIECALHLHGLAELHGELTCVSQGGELPSKCSATFLLPNDARIADVLGRAAAIICSDPSDPSDAVAFARAGFGVVAPITSGAHEFASNVVVWDALDARFLYTATAVAVARPASVRTDPEPPPRVPSRSERFAFVKTP
jgi:hypothetical protein